MNISAYLTTPLVQNDILKLEMQFETCVCLFLSSNALFKVNFRQEGIKLMSFEVIFDDFDVLSKIK
jgi:hypothetical protein